MFKKLQLASLISCICVSTHAATINANFIIENNTNASLKLKLSQPNGQGERTLDIPAGQPVSIPVTNNDYWSINATNLATIKILSAEEDKLYVKGQIVYKTNYDVVNVVLNRRSFLDSVSAADGLTVDTMYSCRSGNASSIFNNKIIITGTPGSAMTDYSLPSSVNSCKGVKSSILREKAHYYTPFCFDGTGGSTFWRNSEIYRKSQSCSKASGCKYFSFYYDGNEKLPITIITKTSVVTSDDIKTALDKVACGGW